MVDRPSRNPVWSRDELILALDLYVRCEGRPSDQQVSSLSILLNDLSTDARTSYAKFRNENGVRMKLLNFRRFDTEFPDKRQNLSNGGRGEEEVWSTFFSRPDLLLTVAESIRMNIPQQNNIDLEQGGEVIEAEEGALLTKIHLSRERNRQIVTKKKTNVLSSNGCLKCEACTFDFRERYGERGVGFAEVHHIQPIHTLRPGMKTRLEDLAILCANCHRMIHSQRPWLSIFELTNLIKTR